MQHVQITFHVGVFSSSAHDCMDDVSRYC